MSGSAVHRVPDDSAALGRFVSVLADGAGDVRAALEGVLGCPPLQIAYWLPDSERWVDGEGAWVPLDDAQPGVTVVRWRGERVAALALDPPADEPLRLPEPLLSAAALALENERLNVVLHARLDEEQALRRVATSVARQHEPEDVLELVTREVARHLRGDSAMTARYDSPGLATVVADWSEVGVKHFPTGRQISISGPTALAQVQRTAAPARVDTYEGIPGDYPAEIREQVADALPADPEHLRDVGVSTEHGVEQDDGTQVLGQLVELLERRLELQPLLVDIVWVGRHALGVDAVDVGVVEHRALVVVLRVQPPRLALRCAEQPPAPSAIARWLVAKELDPRERARVLDVGGIGVDGTADLADQLVVEREEELGLVPAEPYWRLIAPYLIFGGPGGS